jgi:hypothetical protein
MQLTTLNVTARALYALLAHASARLNNEDPTQAMDYWTQLRQEMLRDELAAQLKSPPWRGASADE